jgi:type I restriction enzyme S subunit
MHVEFGSLFHFIRNGMNVKQDKSGDGLPITRIETISNSTVDAGRVGYAGLVDEDCEGWLLERGDILFSHINSVEHVGKCAIYEGRPEKLVHGMNLLCMRCDQSKLLPEFAKYLIRGPAFRGRLSNFINKAVNQASVSIGNLKTIPVSVPSLPEQRRIAAMLDQADALRTKRREALMQLDELQQAIFIEMFGDPTTNPKKWPFAKLGHYLLDVTNGLSRRGSEVETGKHIVLRLRDVRAGAIDFSEPNRITLNEKERTKYQVSHGELLFIRVNGNPDYVGRCALFEGYSEQVFFNDHVMRVRLKAGLNGGYLSHFLNRPEGKREIARHRKTSAGQHTINQDGLAAISFPVPDEHVQRQFIDRVADIRRLSIAHTNALKDTEALFASLQHRAFRGEL